MKNTQTILIVDDIKGNVDVLIDILQAYDTVPTLSGSGALELVQEEDIDLILLDIMMPEMDGYEVCKKLKSNPTTAKIPIIFLTAKDTNDDLEYGFSLGAVDYMTKPFKPNELVARVDTHLKLRAYEKNLEQRVQTELDKNAIKQSMINQQSKQSAIGELTMHIAHQWKQPLATLGSIHMLLLTQLQNDIEISKDELIQQIESSEELIDFMSNTVDTFQDVYTPSNKKIEFSITDSTTKVLNISDATMHYYNINITLHSSETKPSFANENEFCQMLFCILNNAKGVIQKREIQNPEIEIWVENQKISIVDNAGGVEEEMLGELFEPFKSTTGGNGLGLYIANELAKKNDCVLSAQNNLKGATFIIEFLTWID